MENKLYLHLGLHKTATTSLQKFVFPNIPNVIFLGRTTEPLLSQDSFYKSLVSYCFSNQEDLNVENELKLSFQDKLNESSIIISDEWFTADFDGFYKFNCAPWQVKISKLSRIVKGLNVEVLITVRTPFDGVFSQYCEFTQVGIEKYYGDFFNYIMESNDAQAYNYNRLRQLLDGSFKNVTYFRYDDFIKDSNIFKEYFSVECDFEMKNSNIKRKEKNGVYVNKKAKLLSLIINLIPQRVLNVIKNTFFYDFIVKKIIRFFSSQVLVPQPSATEKELIMNELKESSEFYRDINNFKK